MQLKDQIFSEFERLARECSAAWHVGETSCEISRNDFILRVRWRLERDSGVFVTVTRTGADDREYGLPYLIDYLSGDPRDIADASSNDPKIAADLSRKYAAGFLEGAIDFEALSKFAEAQILASMPEFPKFRATKTFQPKWEGWSPPEP